MRRIRYQVAMSLDGYIAGPNGEFDWIVKDPEIDFAEIFKQFDTLLTGHKVYKTGIVSLQLCGEMNLLQRVCAGNAAKAATLRRRAAKPALLFIRVGQPKPCPDENQDARLKPGATQPLH